MGCMLGTLHLAVRVIPPPQSRYIKSWSWKTTVSAILLASFYPSPSLPATSPPQVRTEQALALDPEELRALQRFYDQLCALVEAQRMSDPLSLMVVQKVRGEISETI